MSDSKRIWVTVQLTVFTLSSITMVWLFWRFPVPTSATTIILLAILFQKARLARTFFPDAPVLDDGKQ